MIYPVRAHLRFSIIREGALGFAQAVLMTVEIWEETPSSPQLLLKIFLTEKTQRLVYTLGEAGREGRIVYSS